MTSVTVTELVRNFADACKALVPILDRVDVRWRDGEQYDNWDRIAESLFESLVIEPSAFQAVGEARLGNIRAVPYGFASAANCNAWIALEGDSRARMIDLTSVSAPFDHAQCEEPAGLVPLEQARFTFVYILDDGAHQLGVVNLSAE